MLNFNLYSFEEKEKQLEDLSYLNENGNYNDDNNEYMNRNIDLIYQTERDDENLFGEKEPQEYLDFNIYPKSQIDIIFGDNINDRTTKLNTMTINFKEEEVKEEKNEEIKEEKKEEIKEDKKETPFYSNILNLNELIEKAPEENFLGIKRGRKKKSENSEKIEKKNSSEHNKDSQDNMMRKIKTNVMDWIVNLLNDSLNDKSVTIYKIDKSINEYLKKDFNIKLMDRTIEDIFSNTKISAKYKKNNDEYANYSKIKKILEENVETKAIYYLNKKYIDMIHIIRNNHLEEFLKNIKSKENRADNININVYMNSIRDLLLNYEDWFNTKKGRNRENGQNKQKN